MKIGEYTKEDLQTDIDWLVGNTINKEEAEKFIKSLLNQKWKGE